MLWGKYRGIDQLVSKREYIHTYDLMGVRKDGRAIKTIFFDQGVRKYVRVTVIMIFYQVYVTDHNCS